MPSIMKRFAGLALALTGAFASAGCAQRGMRLGEVGSHLKNLKQTGFRFEKELGSASWIVSFQGPGMKKAWSVVVAVTGEGKRGQFVSVGTTVWKGAAVPGARGLASLMQMNGLDNNIGSLSLFSNESGAFVQYFAKSPLEYCTPERLVFDIGYVGGFAEAVSGKLTEL